MAVSIKEVHQGCRLEVLELDNLPARFLVSKYQDDLFVLELVGPAVKEETSTFFKESASLQFVFSLVFFDS
jgi:hypothetical protein